MEKRLFKLDKSFSEKIPRLARAMLRLMVQDYKDYCEQGLKYPIKKM